jgi:hypothetical protein
MWLSTAENHEKLILCHKYPLLFAISKALMDIPAQNGMLFKKKVMAPNLQCFMVISRGNLMQFVTLSNVFPSIT